MVDKTLHTSLAVRASFLNFTFSPVQKACDGPKLASEHPKPDKEGVPAWSRQGRESETRDGKSRTALSG